MGNFDIELHSEKARLIAFERYAAFDRQKIGDAKGHLSNPVIVVWQKYNAKNVDPFFRETSQAKT